MARPRKFNASEAWELKRKYGYTNWQIGQEYGVCESTVKKAFASYQRDLPQAAKTRVMVKKSIIEDQQKRNIMDIQGIMQDTMDKVTQLQTIVETCFENDEGGVNLNAIQTSKALVDSTRGLVETTLGMMKLMADYERVEEFNKAVFEVLDSCDKRLRQDVIKKLNERKGIYAALK